MLDPLVAQDLWLDLVKALTPAIEKAAAKASFDTGGDSGLQNIIAQLLDGPEGMRAVASGFAELAQRLTPVQMRNMCETFARVTFYSSNGSQWPPLAESFNVHFRGRLDEMYRWLWFALKVNFGPLFKRTGLDIEDGGRFDTPQSQGPSPTISTDTP